MTAHLSLIIVTINFLEITQGLIMDAKIFWAILSKHSKKNILLYSPTFRKLKCYTPFCNEWSIINIQLSKMLYHLFGRVIRVIHPLKGECTFDRYSYASYFQVINRWITWDYCHFDLKVRLDLEENICS